MQENSKQPNESTVSDHPLSMTVYDLPNPNDLLQVDSKRTMRGRLFMMGVLIICAAPVVLSDLTYYIIRPTSFKSYGELIQPTLPIPSIQERVLMHPASESASELINLSQLKGQWLLVSVGDSGCNSVCQHNLYFQRQIHTALGKERDRVDRVWLVTGEGAIAPEVLKGLGDAWVIRVSKSDLSKWLAPGANQLLEDHLYLVDPMGEWMMRFPPYLGIDTAPKLRRDLERLLRASESWDLPGRSVLPKGTFEEPNPPEHQTHPIPSQPNVSEKR